MLADVSNTDLRTTILGQQVEFPICVSPTAMQCLAHPEGENATARGSILMSAYNSTIFLLPYAPVFSPPSLSLLSMC